MIKSYIKRTDKTFVSQLENRYRYEKIKGLMSDKFKRTSIDYISITGELIHGGYIDPQLKGLDLFEEYARYLNNTDIRSCDCEAFKETLEGFRKLDKQAKMRSKIRIIRKTMV